MASELPYWGRGQSGAPLRKMRIIALSQGLSARVSDADYARLSLFKWCAQKIKNTFYAARYRKDGSYEYMHRAILGLTRPRDRGHHRDGDGLNNTRSNLRHCSQKNNLRGFQRKTDCATSRYRGVCWDSSRNRWLAQIDLGTRNTYLGRFTDEAEAARAYDAAAKKFFKSFAQLNFPQ